MGTFIEFKKKIDMRENKINIKLSIGGHYVFTIDYDELFSYLGKYYQQTGIDLVADVEKLPSSIGKILETLVNDRIGQIAETPYEDEKFVIYEDEFTKKYKNIRKVFFKATDFTYMKSFLKNAEKKLLTSKEEVEDFRSYMIPRYKAENQATANFLANRLLLTMIIAREEYIKKCLPIINANIQDLERFIFEEMKKQYKEE